MLYKEDWQSAQEHFNAWWNNEIIDRCLIQAFAPKKNTKIEPNAWSVWALAHNRDNFEFVVNEFEKYCRQTFFGGEAFPCFWINLGPGTVASYIGSNPVFREDTVWFEQVSNFENMDISFDENNKWWKFSKDVTSFVAEKGKDKYITGITDLGGITDVLASLRGTETLLFDLTENPQRIKQYSEKITDVWIKSYSELDKAIKKTGMKGTSGWMGIWSEKRYAPLQCDFSAMISPNMFREFALPYLDRLFASMEHPIYHLDGPGEICHLDMLLDCPNLKGIQWVPSPGPDNTGSPKWFEMYKKIQSKNKLLVLQGMPANKIEGLLKEISSKGVLITTALDSEDEAKDLLKKAEKWAVGA